MNNNELSEWILGELGKRDMSQADLARLSGLAEGTISRILSGSRANPSPKSLKGIAKALQVPIETVYAKAGLVNQKGDREEFIDYIMHLFSQLAPIHQAEIIEIMRLKLYLQAHAEGMTSDAVYAVIGAGGPNPITVLVNDLANATDPETRAKAKDALKDTLVEMGLYRSK